MHIIFFEYRTINAPSLPLDLEIQQPVYIKFCAKIMFIPKFDPTFIEWVIKVRYGFTSMTRNPDITSENALQRKSGNGKAALASDVDD